MGDFTERTRRLGLAELHENYKRDRLDERNCDSNPIEQFARWFEQAKSIDIKEPNAMTLSTAAPDGRPSARIVLLKELDDGFVFYTNYKSRKSAELKANPFAALTFFWVELERQVRVEGVVNPVSRDRSIDYFRTRPRGSKLGAWVSEQSKVVANRQAIEDKMAQIEARFARTEDVPTPEFWGGFRLVPDLIEFWQGRPNRLHDRLQYRRNGESSWLIERLWP
jgi:pyridoxamine 5'-phosphate oxidase